MDAIYHYCDRAYAEAHGCRLPDGDGAPLKRLLLTMAFAILLVFGSIPISVELQMLKGGLRWIGYLAELLFVPWILTAIVAPSCLFALWVQEHCNIRQTAFVEYGGGLYEVVLGTASADGMTAADEMYQLRNAANSYQIVFSQFCSGYFDYAEYNRLGNQYKLRHSVPDGAPEQWYDRAQEVAPLRNLTVLQRTEKTVTIAFIGLDGRRVRRRYSNAIPELPELLQRYEGCSCPTPHLPVHRLYALEVLLAVIAVLCMLLLTVPDAVSIVQDEIAYQRYEKYPYTDYVTSDMMKTALADASPESHSYELERIESLDATPDGEIQVNLIVRTDTDERVEIIFSNYDWIPAYNLAPLDNGWNYIYSVLEQ